MAELDDRRVPDTTQSAAAQDVLTNENLIEMGGTPSSAHSGEFLADQLTGEFDGPSDVAASQHAAQSTAFLEEQGTVIEALRLELQEANARADSEHDSYLRALADYQNFKRRTEEERESLRSFLLSSLLERFLPLVDNFERALTASRQTRDYDKLIGGVEATHRQMLDLLTREGVVPIDVEDAPFDPNLHNAVMREETDAKPEGTILEELQRGYLLGNRVLRPTMVKVATAPSDVEEPVGASA